MDERRSRRVGSFLIGGLVGSVAGLVAAGRMRVRPSPASRATPEGLAAFEGAPCFTELHEAEAGERAEPDGDDGGRW
jgi:hypothetical protein